MSSNTLADIFAPTPKRSRADDVIERLREAIASGRLEGGRRLREEELAEFLGVSRGPIREALVQLEREGLVIKPPNRSATVARLSREDLEEVYSLRLALEQFAIRRAVRNAEAKHLNQMQQVVNTMAAYLERGISEQEAAALDIQFHDMLYESTRHRRLYDFWAILRPQIHIFLLSRIVANADFRDLMISSHQAILDAIRDRDEKRAVEAIQFHLQSAYERIVQSYPVQES